MKYKWKFIRNFYEIGVNQVEIQKKFQWKPIGNPVGFDEIPIIMKYNEIQMEIQIEIKIIFIRNFNEIPREIHLKSSSNFNVVPCKISMKYQLKSFEIKLKFQLKFIWNIWKFQWNINGNPLEIQLKSNLTFNKFQYKSIGTPVEIWMKFQWKLSWNLSDISKFQWHSNRNPIEIQLKLQWNTCTFHYNWWERRLMSICEIQMEINWKSS